MRAEWLLLLAVGCADPPGGDTPLDTGAFADPSASIVGTVSAGVTTVSGARVTTLPHGYETRSAADGAFVLARLPSDTYRLVVAAPGYETVTTPPLSVDAPDTGVVNVTLAPTPPNGSLVATIRGPDGAPRAGATVSIGGRTATTDASGTAIVDALGPQTADVVLAADGLWSYTVPAVAIPEGARVTVAHTLSGRPPADAHPIGSRVCVLCHTDTGHEDTAHARALSTTTDPAVRARFAAGDTVTLDGGTATLALDAGAPVVRLTTDAGTRTFAVAGWIGDPRSGSVPFTELGDQAYALPVAWRAERPGYAGWPEAAERVVPWDASAWLRDGGFTFAQDGRPDPASSADARCLPCHTSGFTLSPRGDGGVDLTSAVGTASRWGEAGVGCERCHGPGSAHFSAPIGEKAAVITRPSRLDTARANEVCGQCHAGLESPAGLPYPHAFQPGEALDAHAAPLDDLWPSGAAASPGQQLDELRVSVHGTDAALPLRCDDCHAPHGAPVPASLYLDARDNGQCLSCHLALTFGGEPATAKAHPNHIHYEPAANTESGRCTGCHMVNTAARVSFHADSGAGDLASHAFRALPPQDTLDVFGTAETLPVGAFPAHACSECHAWGAWRWESNGNLFPGVFGDPTSAATHRAHQTSFDEKFP